MFFVLLVRVLIVILFVYLLYRSIQYFLNPKRRLELAHEQKQFYMLDEKKNTRKNFLVTYQGILFEGEKYLGTTSHSFEIVSIIIAIKDSRQLEGLTRDDFAIIEHEVKTHYPHATIQWKSPVKEFLQH
ncbi:sigma-w pathway protein ysdB [Bacillus sp. CGMCC 1.16541]|uniref:sigma-w pathway protein ysdB n=1 Tax=Bacillus sp. CGMCC 1.16541 TaxID=2185143 RepID=UPI000D73C3B2|nr:sigma-w pathway protein ysdB [Bacillus sp. CGMCC 1.16541]